MYDIDRGASELAQTLRVTSGPCGREAHAGRHRVVTGGKDGCSRTGTSRPGRDASSGATRAAPHGRREPDGTKVASAGVDGQIIRSLQAIPPVRLDGHADLVWGGGWSPEGPLHQRQRGPHRPRLGRRHAQFDDLGNTSRLCYAAFSDAAASPSVRPRTACGSGTGARARCCSGPPSPGAWATEPAQPRRRRLRSSRSDADLRLNDCETCGSLDEVEPRRDRVTRQPPGRAGASLADRHEQEE